jgi:hypothetical protein
MRSHADAIVGLYKAHTHSSLDVKRHLKQRQLKASIVEIEEQ